MIPLACCSAVAQRNMAVDLSSVLPPPNLPAVTATMEELPDAPSPHVVVTSPDPAFSDDNAPPQHDKPTTPGFPPASSEPPRLPPAPGEHPSIPSMPAECQTGVSTEVPNEMSCSHSVDYFQRFADAGVHPLTARQKGILAFRNTVDPWNFATIAFFSAIAVASDPNSAYGPGFEGFARNFGVAYTEAATGEFFGTFLIPAITHQDPHYHRLPNASYTRRAVHTVTSVVWAQSDYGVGMPNYSILIGSAIGDAMGNLYVPGRDKSWGAGVARYLTGLATDPIDNVVTEFLPDVARRVNVHIVLVQWIVNHVEVAP